MCSSDLPRKIAQEEVTHHARMFGESKYGISRTLRVVLDLLAVNFFLRFSGRPGHFFGGVKLLQAQHRRRVFQLREFR